MEIFTGNRIVSGPTPEAVQITQELYASLCRDQIYLTDAKTAELSKLAGNSLRDVNIAFANELAKICDYLDIDVWESISLANLHPRMNILYPGPGVGGHYIAVDPWFIADVTPSLTRLTHIAREVSDSHPDDVAAQAQILIHEVRVENAGQSTKIAVLGLTSRPGIDDLRSSPTIMVADELTGLDKVELLVYELDTATLPPILTGCSNIRKVGLAKRL